MRKQVTVHESYQTGYRYTLTEMPGTNFTSQFKPDLTPKQMLQLGIFGGSYFKEIPKEFPADWFEKAPLSTSGEPDSSLNYFKVAASQSLHEWRRKGWIYEEDPLGWFLWYCRYYLGRRIEEEDQRQIKRWLAMKRHVAQLQKACAQNDLSCRPTQRQALLHWAYDSRKT